MLLNFETDLNNYLDTKKKSRFSHLIIITLLDGGLHSPIAPVIIILNKVEQLSE